MLPYRNYSLVIQETKFLEERERVFKRKSLQISILARQLCPLNSKSFLEIYKKATLHAYGYLFCCLHNLVQMKSVIAPMFDLMNSLALCINFDFIQFCLLLGFIQGSAKICRVPLGAIQGSAKFRLSIRSSIQNLRRDLMFIY